MNKNNSRRRFITTLAGATAAALIPQEAEANVISLEQQITLKDAIDYISSHNIIHHNTGGEAISCLETSKNPTIQLTDRDIYRKRIAFLSDILKEKSGISDESWLNNQAASINKWIYSSPRQILRPQFYLGADTRLPLGLPEIVDVICGHNSVEDGARYFGVVHSGEILESYKRGSQASISPGKTLFGYYSGKDRSLFILENDKQRKKEAKPVEQTVIHELLHAVDDMIGTAKYIASQESRDLREHPIETWAWQYCHEIYKKK